MILKLLAVIIFCVLLNLDELALEVRVAVMSAMMCTVSMTTRHPHCFDRVLKLVEIRLAQASTRLNPTSSCWDGLS